MTRINIIKIIGLSLLVAAAVYAQYKPVKAPPKIEASAEAIPIADRGMHLTPLPTTYSSLHRSAGTTGWGWWSQVHRPMGY